MNYLANPGLPALLALVFLVATVLAARGRRRARIVAAAAGGLLLLVMAPYWIHGFNDEDNQYGGEYAVIDMVAAALCVLGVVLLHRQDNPTEGHTTDPNQT